MEKRDISKAMAQARHSDFESTLPNLLCNNINHFAGCFFQKSPLFQHHQSLSPLWWQLTPCAWKSDNSQPSSKDMEKAGEGDTQNPNHVGTILSFF